MSRFIKFIPSEESDYLQEKHPNAFLLLCQIAKRARRISGQPDGLEIGEAHIGDYKKAGIETRQKYRTALEILEMRGHIKIVETCRSRKKSTTGTTTEGTKIKLLRSDTWDINPEGYNHLINHRATTEQPPSNHEQERIRKNKKEEEEITHGQMAVGCDVIHFDFLENKVVTEKPKYNVYATSPYQATYAYSQRPYQKSTYQKPDKKQSYGKEDNVYFTEKEYDDLLAEGNMTNIERDYWIDQIRLEIGKQGEKEFNRRYKSHYHTILSWKKLREEKTKMVSSPKKTPLNQDNKEYAEKVESNYYSPYWKIVVLSKGIEFCPRSGNIEPKVINYSENGFKEQVESELRKKNFINKSKS